MLNAEWRMMNTVKQIIGKLIRRFKMDWNEGRPIPLPVREDERRFEKDDRNYPNLE
jgi:hypothetical protein